MATVTPSSLQHKAYELVADKATSFYTFAWSAPPYLEEAIDDNQGAYLPFVQKSTWLERGGPRSFESYVGFLYLVGTSGS